MAEVFQTEADSDFEAWVKETYSCPKCVDLVLECRRQAAEIARLKICLEQHKDHQDRERARMAGIRLPLSLAARRIREESVRLEEAAAEIEAKVRELKSWEMR